MSLECEMYDEELKVLRVRYSTKFTFGCLYAAASIGKYLETPKLRKVLES